GKHAATGSAGTSSAGRPGGGSGGGQHRRGSSGREKAEAKAAAAKGQEATTSTTSTTSNAEIEQLRTDLAERTKALQERTQDLQRLQAEYANYRKRVDRDRTTVREIALSGALTDLLPVLDAIGQAREHGELTGGFKSVADSLQAAVSKLGLVSYGERGDEFDPKFHEALTSTVSPDVTVETCAEIFQPGYKVGERIIRPARVAVAEPATGPDGAANSPAAE
ncbi:MAG: nucleotide exchange factor GrpE, partial [Trebonia sp.]